METAIFIRCVNYDQLKAKEAKNESLKTCDGSYNIHFHHCVMGSLENTGCG